MRCKTLVKLVTNKYMHMHQGEYVCQRQRYAVIWASISERPKFVPKLYQSNQEI